MPEVGDVIRHTMIMEVDSVAISNSYYYLVKDNTVATTVEQLIRDIHADWWSRMADVMSQNSATTCSIWENLNGNDPTQAVFQTIIGNVLEDNLPAENAIAVAKKTVRADGQIANAVNKISGLAETLQVGGHLIDYEIGLGLETWLIVDQTYDDFVLHNVIRSFILGEPTVQEVQLVTTNPHIIKVPSRQPVLCRSV